MAISRQRYSSSPVIYFGTTNKSMKEDKIQLTTAGKLLKDLKRYEKKHWSACVVAWIADDDRTLGVVGTCEDEEGDFQIVVEEMEEVLEGIWTVADVIASLESISKEKRVYLAGDGLFLVLDCDGGIFTKADDDDVVGCYVSVFGEYEEEPRHDLTEKEKCRTDGSPAWKARMNNRNGILEGVTFLLCIPLTAYGLFCNIAALVKHSRPLWESALWVPFLALLLYVCIDNLFFQNRRFLY